MKSMLALTMAFGLAAATFAGAAVASKPAGGAGVAAVTGDQAPSGALLQRLARNGADDPASHDVSDDLMDDLFGLEHRHQQRGRGADDGASHDADDDHGTEHHDQGNSGSGNSGSGNSGSGKKGQD